MKDKHLNTWRVPTELLHPVENRFYIEFGHTTDMTYEDIIKSNLSAMDIKKIVIDQTEKAILNGWLSPDQGHEGFALETFNKIMEERRESENKTSRIN